MAQEVQRLLALELEKIKEEERIKEEKRIK
jgi:hypothetical protein